MNIVNTLFTENELIQLQNLYNEAIVNFNYEVEINPFACIDTSKIKDFVNIKFEGLTANLVKELTNEIINYLI